MSSEPMIRASGVSKKYTISHSTSDHITVAEAALARLRHPLRRNPKEDFWALQDVDFELGQGEVLGLIGGNGAGKSTLLKVLTRITGPSAGRIDLWGRVGSLLEVGTGFHPELTGRENVYLNGAIIGMSRSAISRQFDAIVEFAGVARFLDTPVKRYSSGMYVRLAFAVAAHLDTEILLLDEVLAVGDANFQTRCLERIHALASTGRTVILVSHSPQVIAGLAPRALLLHEGRVAFDGDTPTALGKYRALLSEGDSATNLATRRRPAPGFGVDARMVALEFKGPFAEGDPIEFHVTVEAHNDLPPVALTQAIHTVGGPKVGSCHPTTALEIRAGTQVTVGCVLADHHLAPGRYSISAALALGTPDSDHFVDMISDAAEFEIEPASDTDGGLRRWDEGWGPVRFPAVAVSIVGQRRGE